MHNVECIIKENAKAFWIIEATLKIKLSKNIVLKVCEAYIIQVRRTSDIANC